jgi:segregation and condensation protein B
MELSEIIPHIEALIFASEKPLTSLEIVELINNTFGFLEERVSSEQIETCIEGIREKYASEFYPFEVRESGGGWQFLTKKEFHKTIIQLNGDKFLKRLSNAALETLAIIAYKQPITKGEVESIRGVNSDYSVQKLLEKELIIITGRNEKLPGHPLIYTTSKNFMDYFGINTTRDLPKIREVLAEQLIEGTLIDATDFTSNTEIAALPDNSDENEEVIIVEESEETVGVEDVKDKDGEILQAIEEKLITVHRDGEGNIDIEVMQNEEEEKPSIAEESTDNHLNNNGISMDENLQNEDSETALIIKKKSSSADLKGEEPTGNEIQNIEKLSVIKVDLKGDETNGFDDEGKDVSFAIEENNIPVDLDKRITTNEGGQTEEDLESGEKEVS